MTRETEQGSATQGQSSNRHSSKWERTSKRSIVAATWNVRTLVESAGGDKRISRSRPQHIGDDATNNSERTRQHLVDPKLDLLVKELRCYGVSVAAIQETKWFGKDVWQADGHTFLHSGRPLPKDGEPAVRNEGVGILLDERATAAWKEAGEVWNAVSSRVVTARLKLVGAGQRKPGGSREKKNTYLSVVCVYAPTAKAPPGIAQKFTEDLQDTVDKIPTSDVLLLPGDFNARVGCSVADGDVWRGVRGRHGVGCCNEAGEKFLEFYAVNQFTIMNTWFTKKSIHLATWKHPATKQSHMIHYVVMRAEQRMLCTDVQVMRGASCWSDHHMVRVKVRIGLPCQQKKRKHYRLLCTLSTAKNREKHTSRL